MTTSQFEADELAHKVSAYWSHRGLFPQVWTIPELVTASPTSQRISWTVRSDMVGGQPRGAPCPTANFNSETQRESLASFVSAAGMRQPGTGNESVWASQSLYSGGRSYG